MAVLFWLLCAFFSAFIAESKGRGWFGWFVLGVLFGPFALLASIGVGSLKEAQSMAASTKVDEFGFPIPERLSPCRACRSRIHPEATICPHCRTERPHEW